MALVTPEYLQTKKYRALRDRLVLAHGASIQAGVWDPGDFKVTQRAASANLSVDVAAGFALVPANDPGNRGLYHVENDATINITEGAAAGVANPRVDQLVLEVRDTTDGADATDVPRLYILPGPTPTAGAQITDPAAANYRAGAATLPAGHLRLADLLMPASGTSYTTANIVDRRPWARGAFWSTARTTNASGGADYYTTTGTPALIDATNLNPRIECSGAPMQVTITANWFNQTSQSHLSVGVAIDGAAVPNLNHISNHWSTTTGVIMPLHGTFFITPTAGARKIGLIFNSQNTHNSGIMARGGQALQMTVREIPTNNASNT